MDGRKAIVLQFGSPAHRQLTLGTQHLILDRLGSVVLDLFGICGPLSTRQPRTPFFLFVGSLLGGGWRNFRKGLRVNPMDEPLGFQTLVQR